MRIRKQDNSLTILDLMQFPAWEYALDEEDFQGQNEKTIRPSMIPPPLDRGKSYFLVRTVFTLANGGSLIGIIKPLNKGEEQLMQPLVPYDLNPVIVTDQGHVTFCYGAFKPDESIILENYKRLGYGSECIFPIRFQADIEVCDSVDEGVLEGFMYFEQDSQDFFGLKLSDIKTVK